MSKTKAKRAWVTRIEVYQWAMKYLKRRCARVPDSPPAEELYRRLCLIHPLKEEKDVYIKKLLENMQAAWRKQKSRDNQTGKKPHSFVLSEEAERQLSRLSADYGETKTHTLEMIISDSLARENNSRAEKKDEGVYKRRAAIFERELNLALKELHQYQLRLNESGVDTSSPLDAEQQQKVERLSRARKKEIINQLPSLPVSTPKKPRAPKKTNKVFTRRNQAQSTPSPNATGTANTSLSEENHHTTLGVQVESLREKPHETCEEISQSPEHSSVPVDIDTSPSDTPHEELNTYKEMNGKSPLAASAEETMDANSPKACSTTNPPQVSAMTITQDASTPAHPTIEIGKPIETSAASTAAEEAALPITSRAPNSHPPALGEEDDAESPEPVKPDELGSEPVSVMAITPAHALAAPLAHEGPATELANLADTEQVQLLPLDNHECWPVQLNDPLSKINVAKQCGPSGAAVSDSARPEHQDAPTKQQVETERQTPDTKQIPAQPAQLNQPNHQEAESLPEAQACTLPLESTSVPRPRAYTFKQKVGEHEFTVEIHKKRRTAVPRSTERSDRAESADELDC